MTPYTYNLPMLPDFSQYIYIENGIQPGEIQKINDYWDTQHSEQAVVEGGAKLMDESLRKTSILGLENDATHKWLYERISNYAIQQNNERYFYDIRGIFESLQLMDYGVGDFFDWHLDFGSGYSSIRKLSVTIQLSDPSDYEGGELQFMQNKDIVNAPKGQGTVVIFPSFVMHRVAPITNGRRRSIVGWISGPPYR